MFRIGIIGTENSHAMHFAKFYNLPNPETGKVPYEDIRVTALLGDPDSTAAIVAQVGPLQIVQTAEEMLPLVDAVMITSRRGSVHKEYALPFIRRSVPIFIDKPFTSDPAEAEELMAEIIKYDCPAMGGSACKYLPGVQAVKETVAKLRENEEFVSAAINFRIQLDSEYDGIYFYASHLVEMCLEAFGMDIKQVQAMRNGKNLLVNVSYASEMVSLHFIGAGKTSCLVYGKKQNYCFDIDTAGLYALEAGYFADMLHGAHAPLTSQQHTQPVHIIAAIKEAMETGSVVAV